MFEFAWPWLWLLAPLPLLIMALAPKAQHRENAVCVPFFERVSQLQLQSGNPGGRHWLAKVLLLAVWLACVAAAAKPQWVGDPINLPASGRDLLLAVDISGSMEIADMVVRDRNLTRIDVVKYVMGDFVKRRKHDRLGLILFGSNAYLKAPLTFDRDTVNTFLQETYIGFAGQQTAIGDAIGLSIKRLRDRTDNHRVVILMTDGANNSGEVDPRQAAQLAKLAGITIHTIAFGAEEMIQQTPFGPRRINPSHDLDEETMRYIADLTGGRYFRARSPEELLEAHAELDRIEPIELEDEIFRPIKALYPWPLGLALLLSFALAMMHTPSWAPRKVQQT